MTIDFAPQKAVAGATRDDEEVSKLATLLGRASEMAASAEDTIRPGQIVSGLPSAHYVFFDAAFRASEANHKFDTARLALAVAPLPAEAVELPAQPPAAGI